MDKGNVVYLNLSNVCTKSTSYILKVHTVQNFIKGKQTVESIKSVASENCLCK